MLRDGFRELACELVHQAVVDVRGGNERERVKALAFLRCSGGRQILEGLGLDPEVVFERLGV